MNKKELKIPLCSSTEEYWQHMLYLIMDYMVLHNERPKCNHDSMYVRSLGRWLCKQLKLYKLQEMKDLERYELFDKFIKEYNLSTSFICPYLFNE